jgi:hypothetical protein
MVLHIVYLYFPFCTQEKDQRYKELGLRDKITLSSGRFLLGNKYDTIFLWVTRFPLFLFILFWMLMFDNNW